MSSKAKSKAKSVKFLLAPRPQRDPLAADFEAPQHVLVPKGGLDIEKARKRLPDFDPTLFESKDETKTGMLERAYLADGMTFDPDVLKAMSKDFDYDDPNNVLDDSFVAQAGGFINDEGEMFDDEMSELTKDLFNDDPELIEFGPDDDKCNDGDDDDYDSDNYDLDDELGNRLQGDMRTDSEYMNGQGRKLIMFKKKSTRRGTESDREKLDPHHNDDNKSVFTNYSMTSSVMRRNQGLQEMDEHFERLFEREYADDTEVGALDLKDVKGDELLTNVDQIKELKEEIKQAQNLHHGDEYKPEIVSEHYKNAIIDDDPVPEDEESSEEESNRRENRLDCESILSYNSNLYNHPKLIVERRKKAHSQSASIADQMDLEDDSDQRSRSQVSRSIASTRASILSKLSIRPKDETSEDRRARKKALKAYRQERRKERKQNQQIFKTEQANIIKQQRNNKPALRLA